MRRPIVPRPPVLTRTVGPRASIVSRFPRDGGAAIGPWSSRIVRAALVAEPLLIAWLSILARPSAWIARRTILPRPVAGATSVWPLVIALVTPLALALLLLEPIARIVVLPSWTPVAAAIVRDAAGAPRAVPPLASPTGDRLQTT